MNRTSTLCVMALACAAWASVRIAAAQDPLEPAPLDFVCLEMRTAGGKLHKLTTGEPTQETQKEVLQKLNVLIKKLEEERDQQQNGQGSSSANPTRPARRNAILGGPGGQGDLHAPKRTGRDWGQLPEKERQRILQSLTEGFPPHYQAVLERYFKQLADEQGATATESDASKPSPTKTDAAPGATTK